MPTLVECCSGYLESQQQLRDHLMRSEWNDKVRQWALHKGVAEFERFVVEKSHEVPGLDVNWEQMQVTVCGSQMRMSINQAR